MLQKFLLRRTKKLKINGKTILELPEKNEKIATFEFSPEEV
jgi:SNF2 family DNA or RNA helicase